MANLLKQTVAGKPDKLVSLGWNPDFVRNSMGDMAASAIMEGRGNSGDLVRVVVDVAIVSIGHRGPPDLDKVYYWRTEQAAEEDLDDATIVALTKVFGELTAIGLWDGSG